MRLTWMALGCALAVASAACNRTDVAVGTDGPGGAGDPERGRLLLRQFGCGTCHRIPLVADAEGRVGPPLDAVARRVYLAGMVPNTPDGMVRWIRHPRTVDPQTAMPDLGVGEAHARDMAAYLHSLR